MIHNSPNSIQLVLMSVMSVGSLMASFLGLSQKAVLHNYMVFQ